MSESSANRRIIVSERPRFSVPNTKVFGLDTAPKPKPGDGEILIRTTWLGIEPYLYGRLKATSSQTTPVSLGDVMVGPTVGRVEISNRPDYAKGDMVQGFWGWQDYHVSDGSQVSKSTRIFHALHTFWERWGCPASARMLRSTNI